ncbi:MAG: CehA/McbA family metallohydrolase [Myxococcaceae bacterium]
MLTNRLASMAALTAVLLAPWVLGGCSKEGCLTGEPGCRVPSPCQQLAFECSSTYGLDVHAITDARRDRPAGADGLASNGDVLLTNGTVTAVIDRIGSQNYLDPNGGSLLDLANVGKGNDGMNQVLQVVGILPGDSAQYTSLEVIDERPARVAVQVGGTLYGHPDLRVNTIYELRPCEPGLRVRTEIFNGETNQQLWALSDGWYWSKREAIPFTPEPGAGYAHPSFNLLTINDAFRPFPYMAASTPAAPHASYSEVSCTDKLLEGFQSEMVSSVGLPRKVVPPRGYQVFERFIAVAPRSDIAGAADIAMEVRTQLFHEPSIMLRGKVELSGALALDRAREVSILVSEGRLGDDVSKRTPWTQVVPRSDGVFFAMVPAGKDYVIEVHSFGQKAIEKEASQVSTDLDLGTLTLPSTARVTFQVIDEATTAGIDAEIFVIPVDEATRTRTAGAFHGQFGTCYPWLGPPPGNSPACNRILVRAGQATAEVPVGNFHFYAFHGPFWTLARRTAELTPTAQTLGFSLRKLPLQPAGTLSGDLHVHGAASFDSSIPDMDRVLSFSAGDLQVVVATDHDVVYDYSTAAAQLGLTDKFNLVDGVETTGHIPFMRIPDYGFPLVIGHYNFWPLRFDPTRPRNGGPFDEFVEPGELFDRVKPRFSGNGLIELNHPWADTEFGRDLGYPRALALNTLQDLPADDDGTAAGMYVRAPKAGLPRNNSHDAQEVMNGSQGDALLAYRAFWWFTLGQKGQLKTGTANSDSHGLTDNTVGMPRNLVWTSTQAGATFKVDDFNQAIKEGKVLGTNGPVIEATVEDLSGARRPFGLGAFKPKPGATVFVKVSAAPWVPVQEIRFVVNGKVVKTLSGASLSHPTEPFGDTGLVRFDESLPLSDLVSGTSDAWLVIEAGQALPLSGDLGGTLDGKPDGIPDTGDNDGNGVVDAADIASGQKYGPLKNAPPPSDEADPLYHYGAITEGYPFAFTNPFVLDVNGDDRFDAPGVQGGN